MPTAPHRVVALALPGVVLLDLAAPTHLFGHCGAPHYAFSLAGVTAGPVVSSTGIEVIAGSGLDALAAAETVVVPGFEAEPPADAVAAAAGAVRRAHERGARVMSVCTGAFLLAAAGVLDGRRATTHWHSAGRLAREYPAVTVDPGVLYVDEGSVLTSAGVASGLDLCLHVIRSDLGASVAAQIARRTVIPPHREGGQAQFIPGERVGAESALGGAGTLRGVGAPGGTGSLEPTREWALRRLGEPLDVPAMARHASVSPRTFARRFRAETGTTPGQWVLEQRTRAAQALLEESELPVEHVAQHCGFGSAATLRAHFTRRLRTTPTAYRKSFRPAAQ